MPIIDFPLGTPYMDVNAPLDSAPPRPEIVGEANDLARYKDTINPDHYKKGDIEVIDLTRYLGFREGNVVKYVSRHKEKGGKEDILKAIWYLEDILNNDYGC